MLVFMYTRLIQELFQGHTHPSACKCLGSPVDLLTVDPLHVTAYVRTLTKMIIIIICAHGDWKQSAPAFPY